MTAQIFNLRDYQSKAALDRARQVAQEHLNQQAIEIANMAFPSVFGFVDPPNYLGPNPFYTEKDPA